MSDVMLSFLQLDGKLRMTCNGCTESLEKRGMVKRLWSRPHPGGLGDLVIYEIAFPYTLEFCQATIAERHVGKLWGAR